MERSVSLAGARELKTRLGSYLKRVGRGHSFIVTDRHEPIAELRPHQRRESVANTRLSAMAALGALTPPSRSRLSRFPPLATAGRLASAMIRRDRDERF